MTFCGTYGYIDNLCKNLPDDKCYIFGSNESGDVALGRLSYLKDDKLLGTRGYLIDNNPQRLNARTFSVLFNDSEATAIKNVLGDVEVVPCSKVYNIKGQHVGDSLNSLPKGIYIINGKKVMK